nr:precorrin-6A reductase [Tissierella sp.]
MIWILGGTSEARKIVERIGDLDNYLLTIATEDGREFFPSENLIVGRMSYKEMVSFAKEKRVSMIVDLTHPYAKIVSDNGEKVAEELSISYIRYVREISQWSSKAVYLSSYEETYRYLAGIKGRVFFTTGSKNIGDFEKVRGENKYTYRILPAIESLEICKVHAVHMRDIVAILGPFSLEFNKSMLKEYKAEYCIMKDSGKPGGTLEKIQACEELNITPIVIARDEEAGINNLEKIEDIIRSEHKRLEKI